MNKHDPKGKWFNPGFHSEETKIKISNTKKGTKLTETHKKNIGSSLKGRKLSQKEIERRQQPRGPNKHPNSNKGIKRGPCGKVYKNKGVKKGKMKKVPKRTCNICGLTTTPTNIARWHNEKCKSFNVKEV